MRVVADTNIVISGLLWNGNPRMVLDAARDGIIEIFSCPELLAELRGVLEREKFKTRLDRAGVSIDELIDGFAALASLIDPGPIAPVVERDPDDDVVIACALAADCEYIVSGDDDLLSLNSYRGILIRTAADLLAEISLLGD